MNLQCLGILLWHQHCCSSQEIASLLQENSSSVECDEHAIATAQGLGNLTVFSPGQFGLNAALNTGQVLCREGSCPCPAFYGAAKMTSAAAHPPKSPWLKDYSKKRAVKSRENKQGHCDPLLPSCTFGFIHVRIMYLRSLTLRKQLENMNNH